MNLIAADDHSEIRLKKSLEAALGIQYITKLSEDVLYLKAEERKGFVQIPDEDLGFKEKRIRDIELDVEKLYAIPE